MHSAIVLPTHGAWAATWNADLEPPPLLYPRAQGRASSQCGWAIAIKFPHSPLRGIAYALLDPGPSSAYPRIIASDTHALDAPIIEDSIARQ